MVMAEITVMLYNTHRNDKQKYIDRLCDHANSYILADRLRNRKYDHDRLNPRISTRGCIFTDHPQECIKTIVIFSHGCIFTDHPQEFIENSKK